MLNCCWLACCVQGQPEGLKQVVDAVKKQYGVEYIYCWHGLPAYWSGISTEDDEMLKYGAEIRYAKVGPPAD